jgi:hypothetical protein
MANLLILLKLKSTFNMLSLKYRCLLNLYNYYKTNS